MFKVELVILREFQNNNISHLLINWRFFLQEASADRLGEGVTIVLRERFAALVENDILQEQQRWGPIYLYSVEELSSDSSSSSSDGMLNNSLESSVNPQIP